MQLALTDQLTADLQDVQYDPADYETVAMPTLGADNGLRLYNMIGLPFDDPQWQTLLDQLTFDEMVSLIGDSFHWRMPAKSIEAPGTRDENGPQGLTASLLGSGATQLTATAFTSEDVMAATFNTDLMYQIATSSATTACRPTSSACMVPATTSTVPPTAAATLSITPRTASSPARCRLPKSRASRTRASTSS